MRRSNNGLLHEALTLAICALGCIAFATSAHAADDAGPSPDIIVTATRTQQSRSDTLPSVTVISRDDIARTQVHTLPELFAGIPGIDVTTNGGIGHEATVLIRGTNSSHSVVLIDGVRVGSATTGAAAWQLLPPSEIERIEIVRGPRSALYGSGAIGGVIQIFTRAAARGLDAHVHAGTGTYNTREGVVALSGGSDASRAGITLSRLETDGFNVQLLAPGSLTMPEPDEDGSTIDGMNLRLQHAFPSGAHVHATLLRSQGDVDFDGAFQDSTEFVQQALSLGGVVPITASWTLNAGAGRSIDSADSFKAGTAVGSFDTIRNSAYLQADAEFGASTQLSAGVDFQREEVGPKDTYEVSERTTFGSFALLQQKLGRASLEAAVRNDHYNSFGDRAVGSLGGSYQFGRDTRLILTHGTAFRAPSFNQLYFEGFGDPTLKPESSASTEIGIEHSRQRLSSAVRVYSTDIKNLIATVCDSTFNCAPENVDSARIRGIEAQVAVTLGGTRVSLGSSFIDPRDRHTGRLLARRAKRTARLDLDRALQKISGGISVVAESGRYDNAANTVWTSGHVVTHIHLSYQVSPVFALQARVGNALDERYQTVASFNTSGRTAFVSFEWNSR